MFCERGLHLALVLSQLLSANLADSATNHLRIKLKMELYEKKWHKTFVYSSKTE